MILSEPATRNDIQCLSKEYVTFVRNSEPHGQASKSDGYYRRTVEHINKRILKFRKERIDKNAKCTDQ